MHFVLFYSVVADGIFNENYVWCNHPFPPDSLRDSPDILWFLPVARGSILGSIDRLFRDAETVMIDASLIAQPCTCCYPLMLVSQLVRSD